MLKKLALLLIVCAPAVPFLLARTGSVPPEYDTAIIRLSDRGLIGPGMAAGLVVFNREKVRDRSTFDKPHQYAGGSVHMTPGDCGEPTTAIAPPDRIEKLAFRASSVTSCLPRSS